MTLIDIAFVVVAAGAIVLFGGMYWLESRRPEVRRRTDATVSSDLPAAGASHDQEEGSRRHG